MSANALDTLWLEERKLTDLIKQPVIRGILDMLLAFAVFMGLWWVFMDPRGVLRWYTPQYGYMYIRWLLIIAIWQVYIFNFWPFKLTWMEKAHPLKKGLILIAINFAVTGLLVWVFYYNIFGRLAIPYFSWPELKKTGLSDFFSREYSSLAILMMAAIASWLSPIWPSAFENYPWHKLKQPAKGLTVFAVTFLLTTYAYLIFMHPHYRVLFYPWQEYTAAFPWWYDSFQDAERKFQRGLDHVRHRLGMVDGDDPGAISIPPCKVTALAGHCRLSIHPAPCIYSLLHLRFLSGHGLGCFC